MTLTELRKTYKEAKRYYDQYHNAKPPFQESIFAQQVMALCMEVERLRMIADERNAEYSDYTRMPFGQYKDRRLADVPDEYLQWWRRTNPSREAFVLDWQYAKSADRVIASMKLRLFDYIEHRFNAPEIPEA